MRMVTTGGRGFIGSHFVELALDAGHHVTDIDCMTYCGNASLPFDSHPNYRHLKEDISEIRHLPFCDIVVNFAAETHVDNSITYSKDFVKTNIVGVHNLLDLVRGKVYERPIFFQISTDEVYGDRLQGEFMESDSLNPSNPYSATKAAAEHLVKSYSRTYGIDYVITRSSNNYGPRQYEEKLISKSISCLKEGRKIPLHGDGSYTRDWIYVVDNARAILQLIESGCKNEVFNISGGLHLSNVEVVKQVCGWFKTSDWESNVQYTENRLGQDVRYSISSEKLESFGVKIPKRDALLNYMEKK
ncbi:NAD-dependent epimerase/dehydratase family protein [bacterium]|nr:NAD-dependent epimerase/dehydratase family protein [bacterium]